MFGLSPAHLVVILIIALIFVGPGKLPEVGAALGKSIREFQKAAGQITEANQAPAPAQPIASMQPPAPMPPAQSYYAAQPVYAAPASPPQSPEHGAPAYPAQPVYAASASANPVAIQSETSATDLPAANPKVD